MNCETLAEGIVDLARGRPSGAGTSAAIAAHLEHCAGCRAALAREQQVSDALRALSAASAGAVPSEIVRSRLLDAFSEHQTSRRRSAGAAQGRRWAQVAAAIAAVAVGVAWLSRETVRLKPDTTDVRLKPEARDVRLKPEARDVRLKPEARDVRLKPDTTDVATLPRRAARGATPAPSPRVIRPEGFVALPEAIGLPDFESGQIVRLEIPLPSLPSYGIQIPPDARGTPVQADLLVGQDGQPRAIRLVRSADGGS